MRHRVEIRHREQLGHIDVLGREPAPQHVVTAGHDLDREAVEVAVHRTGFHEDDLPRCETT